MKGLNQQLDRIIGLCGLVLAIVPLADWSGIFEAMNAVCIGLLSVFIAGRRNKTCSTVPEQNFSQR